MSNVMRALYSGADKQAVVGKIYEDLFHSEGNVSVRYIRPIKAKVAITAGDPADLAADAKNYTVLLVLLRAELLPCGWCVALAGIAQDDLARGLLVL